MKPQCYLSITTFLILLSSGNARADQRNDALRAIEDAASSVREDRGRDCRRVALRDLDDAGRALDKAHTARELGAVASWLQTLADDASDACETVTVRDIRRAQREVSSYAAAVEASAKQEREAEPAPMSASDFATLKAAVGKTSFSDDRIQIISAALAHNYASVAQLGELLGLISFDEDRLALVSAVPQAIVDRKKNGYKIAGAFSFSETGKKAVAILTR